jgi:hypothetical protein
MPAFDPALGSSTATSYISVAQADDYYLGTLNEAAWTALSEAEKEAALMAATQALETLTYAGIRCTPSTDDPLAQQALQWPRSNATCKGIEAVCTMLPSELIGATASLALNLHTSPPTPGAGSSGSTGAVKRQKLGDLEQEFYDVREGASTKVDASAPLILQQYSYLVDLLGCWSETATGSSRVALRVRS